jgi:hypothetical protein
MHDTALFDALCDKRRQEYLSRTRELLHTYIEKPKKLKSNHLLSLTRWPKAPQQYVGYFSFEELQTLFDAKNCDQEEGGYFLALAEKGICINPGTHFFEAFCEKGNSLQDIDIVIVTKNDKKVLEAVGRLQALNRECNRTLVSLGLEPHIIRFFLEPELYSPLFGTFRPQFREEKESIVSLETFSESAESIMLEKGLSLSYMKSASSCLAIRLDADSLSFGFLAGGGVHEGLVDFFSPCNILLIGIGECSPEDLEKVRLEKDSVGYFGLYSLLEHSSSCKLALVSEFSRHMGDLRIELARKLVADLRSDITLLPLDHGFSLELDALAVKTAEKSFASYDALRVVRPNGSFGPLVYVAEEDLL